MLRVGLTGGIGSGKSTVLQMLQALGAAAIDADALSRQATASGGAAIGNIARRFGAEFIAADGSLDRARMRAHAYADPTARHALEAIIHPIVGQQCQQLAEAAREAGSACLVFDIPLLVESGRWRSELARVLVVDCSTTVQLARVVARSGLAAAEVEAIIAAQAPRALRLAAADVVIHNEALSLDQLRAEVALAAKGFGL